MKPTITDWITAVGAVIAAVGILFIGENSVAKKLIKVQSFFRVAKKDIKLEELIKAINAECQSPFTGDDSRPTWVVEDTQGNTASLLVGDLQFPPVKLKGGKVYVYIQGGRIRDF